jgi:outer membrane protein
MKNRIVTMAVLLCVVASPGLLRAQGSAAAGTGKVGIINIQEAIATTGEGKKALADIQAKFRPRQQELQRQQQEIQALTDQLQKQANTLSDEEQRRLSRELDEKQRLFKRATEDYDTDSRAEGQDVFNRIGKKMVPLINEYAQQNGYTLIFDPLAVQVPVYYVKDIDITEDVIKRYDAANPVKADATAPASPAAASRPAAKPVAPAPKPADKPKP